MTYCSTCEARVRRGRRFRRAAFKVSAIVVYITSVAVVSAVSRPLFGDKGHDLAEWMGGFLLYPLQQWALSSRGPQ